LEKERDANRTLTGRGWQILRESAFVKDEVIVQNGEIGHLPVPPALMTVFRAQLPCPPRNACEVTGG